MEFAVCDYAHRAFEHVYAELGRAPAAVLQRATDAIGSQLCVDAGPLVLLAPDVAAMHVSWRRPDGRLWLTAELRVLAVNRGAESVTELLMLGEAVPVSAGRADLVEWVHGVLAELADHPAPMATAIPSLGGAYSRLLALELARHGG